MGKEDNQKNSGRKKTEDGYERRTNKEIYDIYKEPRIDDC